MNKRYFVQQAYNELGVTEWQYDLQPDEIQAAISRMDAMVASWTTRGITLGYNMTSTDPDAESGVPQAAETAVILSLAAQIAPSIGKNLNPATLANQRNAFDSMQTYFTVIPQRRFPSTMPRGAGNKPLRWGTLQQFYGGTDYVPDNPEPIP